MKWEWESMSSVSKSIMPPDNQGCLMETPTKTQEPTKRKLLHTFANTNHSKRFKKQFCAKTLGLCPNPPRTSPAEKRSGYDKTKPNQHAPAGHLQRGHVCQWSCQYQIFSSSYLWASDWSRLLLLKQKLAGGYHYNCFKKKVTEFEDPVIGLDHPILNSWVEKKSRWRGAVFIRVPVNTEDTNEHQCLFYVFKRLQASKDADVRHGVADRPPNWLLPGVRWRPIAPALSKKANCVHAKMLQATPQNKRGQHHNGWSTVALAPGSRLSDFKTPQED